MMIRFVVLFLASNACVYFVKAQKPCDGVLGLKFRPDPQYCHVYHLCGNGKDMSFECGQNLLWNQDLSKCVPVPDAKCTKYNKWAANSPPPPRPPMAPKSLRSSKEWRYNPFGESTWRPTCPPGSKRRVAHPTRCAQYYDCGANPREDWWGKHLRECPYPTLFDEKIGACGYYSNVNCGKRRLPIDPCDYLSNRCRTSHCVPCYIRFASCAGLRNGINPWRGREKSPFFVVCKQERVVFHGRCVSPEPGRRHIFSSRYNTCIRSLDRIAGKTPTIDFNNMYYSELPKISQQNAQGHHVRHRQQNANQYQEPGPHTLTKVGHHDVHPDFHKGPNTRTQPAPAQNTFSHNNGQQKHQPSHPQYKPHSQHSNAHHSHPSNNHPPKRNQFSQPPPNNRQGQPPNAGPAPQYPPYKKPHQPQAMSHGPPPNHGPHEPAPPAPITGQKSSPAQQHPKYNSPQSGQPPQYPPYERAQKPQSPAPKHQPYEPANSPPVRPPYEQPKAQPNPPKPISGPPPQKPNFQPANPQANRHVHQMAAFEHKPQVNLPPQAPTTREQSRVTHSKASFANNMNAPKPGPNYQNKFNQQQYKPANNYPRKQPEQPKWKPKPKSILSQGSWHQSKTNQISKVAPPQPPKRNNPPPPPPPQNKWQQRPKSPQSPNRWQKIPHKTLAPEPIKHGSKPTPTSSFGPQTPPRRKEMVVQPVRREMIKKNTQPWNNQQNKPNYMSHHQSNTQNNIQKSPQMPNNQVPKHNHVQQRYDPNQKPVNKYQPPPPPQPPKQPRKPNNNNHNANQRPPPQNSFNQNMHHVPQNKPQNTFNNQPYKPPTHNRPHHSNNQRPPHAPKMPEHPGQPQNQNNAQPRSHPPHQHIPQSPPHSPKYQQPPHYSQNNQPAKAPIQHQGSNLQQPSTHNKQPHYQPPNMQQKPKPPMYQPQQQQPPQHIGQNKPPVQPGPYKQQPPKDWRNTHTAGNKVVQEQKPAYQPKSWSPAGSLSGPPNNQQYQQRPQQPPVNYQPAATVNSKYTNPNQQHGQVHNRPGPPQNPPQHRNEPSPPTSHPQYHYRPTKSAQFSNNRNNGQGDFNTAFERRV